MNAFRSDARSRAPGRGAPEPGERASVDGLGMPKAAPRGGLSLKGRALRVLSQREHSRLELLRKLGPHAESAEQLESLIRDLEQAGWLSEQRFAESVVHRRAGRFGLRRIEQELSAHRVDDAVAGPVLQALRLSERDRALAAWAKRFGAPPVDAADRARQQRFLAQRGFASEAVAWVLRHGAPQHACGETGPGTAAD
jgi:regulatory protein